MINFSEIAKVGDEYYLTKDCGGLTLVEIVSKTDTHVYVKFIIDNTVRRLSNECFNKRAATHRVEYRDEYNIIVDNNKYLTNANALRNYYNKRDYININRQP